MPVIRRHLILLLLALAIAGLAGSPDAQSHARPVRSDPADQAKLSVAPGRVDVWFDERLDQGFHSARVLVIQGRAKRAAAELIKGQPRMDSADPSHLVIDLAPLPPGRYAVEWRVLSLDGHSTAGRITFEVQATL